MSILLDHLELCLDLLLLGFAIKFIIKGNYFAVTLIHQIV